MFLRSINRRPGRAGASRLSVAPAHKKRCPRVVWEATATCGVLGTDRDGAAVDVAVIIYGDDSGAGGRPAEREGLGAAWSRRPARRGALVATGAFPAQR